MSQWHRPYCVLFSSCAGIIDSYTNLTELPGAEQCTNIRLSVRDSIESPEVPPQQPQSHSSVLDQRPSLSSSTQTFDRMCCNYDEGLPKSVLQHNSHVLQSQFVACWVTTGRHSNRAAAAVSADRRHRDATADDNNNGTAAVMRPTPHKLLQLMSPRDHLQRQPSESSTSHLIAADSLTTIPAR